MCVHEGTDDETILFLEGNEDNDKRSERESGKAIEKTTQKFKLAAQGLVRGMQIKHLEINGEEKNLSVVKIWRSRTAKADCGPWLGRAIRRA